MTEFHVTSFEFTGIPFRDLEQLSWLLEMPNLVEIKFMPVTVIDSNGTRTRRFLVESEVIVDVVHDDNED